MRRRRPVENRQQSGRHQVIGASSRLEGREFPSGIYIARLVRLEHTKSIKMVLLKQGEVTAKVVFPDMGRPAGPYENGTRKLYAIGIQATTLAAL